MKKHLIDELNKFFENEVEEIIGYLEEVVESPIEMALATALVTFWRIRVENRIISMPIAVVYADVFDQTHRYPGAVLVPQMKYKNERYDFVLYCPGIECPIVIECDGHDFHEKTKAQARKDRSRDRAIQIRDARILRFTGSEIWESAIQCAEQIVDAVETELVSAASRAVRYAT